MSCEYITIMSCGLATRVWLTNITVHSLIYYSRFPLQTPALAERDITAACCREYFQLRLGTLGAGFILTTAPITTWSFGVTRP